MLFQGRDRESDKVAFEWHPADAGGWSLLFTAGFALVFWFALVFAPEGPPKVRAEYPQDKHDGHILASGWRLIDEVRDFARTNEQALAVGSKLPTLIDSPAAPLTSELPVVEKALEKLPESLPDKSPPAAIEKTVAEEGKIAPAVAPASVEPASKPQAIVPPVTPTPPKVAAVDTRANRRALEPWELPATPVNKPVVSAAPAPAPQPSAVPDEKMRTARIEFEPHRMRLSPEGSVAQAQGEARPACLAELDSIAKRSVIWFAAASTALTPAQAKHMTKLVSLFAKCPVARLDVLGHADQNGTEAGNMAVSRKRAESTIASLKQIGADASRMTAIGKGASEPLATPDNSPFPDPNAVNRRVEFAIRESAN